MIVFLTTLSLAGEPKQEARWKHPPRIVVCASLPLEPERILHSFGWWVERGYDFSQVELDYDGFECMEHYIPGAIMITRRYRDDRRVAETYTRMAVQSKTLLAARIELSTKAYRRERVLIHEIGHALGWTHTSKVGHLMNPIYQRGGWQDFGIYNPIPVVSR